MWMTTTLILAAEMAANQEGFERRIVISVPDRMLAIVVNGEVVKVYPTAVGARRTPSPEGEYKIISRLKHPTWYGPNKVVVAPGKGNPLGTRWIGLSLRGYGIHGTNNPRSIGRKVSHGCIRMRNADVEDLFRRVRVGDAVVLLHERTDEIAAIFGNPDSAEPTVTAAAE